jgi:hypothetical protein
MQICCFTCIYWNRDKSKPRCWALKGFCNPNSEYCDYIEEK